MGDMRVEGYRQWLMKAIRSDELQDWNIHAIDYATFKAKLRFFSKRRAELRRALRRSTENSISAEELDEMMGPPPEVPTDNIGGQEDTVLLLPTPRRYNCQSSPDRTDKGTGGWSTRDDIPNQYIAFGDEEASRPRAQNVPFQIEANMSPPALSSFWNSSCVKKADVLRHVSNFERNDVTIFLAMELDRAAAHYMTQWQVISQQLLDYQTSVSEIRGQQIGLMKSRIADPILQSIGRELLELESFVTVNLVTARQILIRYDAFARSLEGTPMSDNYIKFMMNEPGLRFWETGAKDGALSKGFRKLMQHAELLALSEKFEDLCYACQDYELNERFSYQRLEFSQLLESSEREHLAACTGHTAPVQDTCLTTLRQYFLLGMIEDRLGYEPTYLTNRGSSLTKEIQQLATWRRKYMENTEGEGFEDKADDSISAMDSQERFNLIMALLAAFLYCMNYYIVEPSSTMYVNALGGQDALAGALIGMMPMASFLAAITYSIWTNYSYRHPFLVSCSLMFVGNLMYSYAFEYKSLVMAFTGRFITGLGGPKCIVRRYMADTTSVSIRTNVNAFFGMMVATGSAFGPGIAIFLSGLNFTIRLPGNIEIVVNAMTSPGYWMALLWAIFTAAALLGFVEPSRSGLEEQMSLEGIKLKSDILGDDSKHSLHSQALTPNEASQNEKTPDDLQSLYSGVDGTSDDASLWIDTSASSQQTLEKIRQSLSLVTLPVRICLGLLFAKVFVIETLVSSTSTISKNRYQWQVREVGILGCVNGLFVIPLSIAVGRFSMSSPDRILMMWMLCIGLSGTLQLIDLTDLFNQADNHYNSENFFAVGPKQYILGYFLVYTSIQSFEGIVGSTLSKVVPTTLASGTLNSGLLATLVDTFGRTCGDLFISICAFIDLRELMNLLFIPGAIILATCLVVVRKYYDVLAV